jgi:hypothetical protein
VDEMLLAAARDDTLPASAAAFQVIFFNGGG